MRNRAVDHNVAAFSELSFALCWQGRLVLRVTALIERQVINYSSNGGQSYRKGRQVSAKLGSLSIICIQLGPRKLSIIQSREVATKQGFLKYYSEWRCSRDQGECPP